MIANIPAEAAVISAIMQSASAIDRISDIVKPEDFADPLMGRIFGTACALHFANKSAGPIAINSLFAADPAYHQAGGPALMAKLTGEVGSLVGAVDLAKQVAELARRRCVADGWKAAADLAADQATSLSEAIELADAVMANVTEGGEGIEHKSGAECVDAMLLQLDSQDRGVTSGSLSVMDDLLGGARRKQLIILAARPGMGKTAVALSYSVGAARKGHGVLYVSLEMSGAELGARMAADVCFDGERGVSYGEIVKQVVNRDDLRKLQRARAELSTLPLHVVDASALHVARLGNIVRRYARKIAANGKRLDLVVVDYLQLLSADKGKSQYETVSQISRALKAIAKENDVAVLALAQLSREVEKRAGCRPQLSDLRDSGQIEQDADTVMFLLRNEYYLQREKPTEDTPEYFQWQQVAAPHMGKIEFICAKRRNGEAGNAFGSFYGRYQAVRDL